MNAVTDLPVPQTLASILAPSLAIAQTTVYQKPLSAVVTPACRYSHNQFKKTLTGYLNDLTAARRAAADPSMAYYVAADSFYSGEKIIGRLLQACDNGPLEDIHSVHRSLKKAVKTYLASASKIEGSDSTDICTQNMRCGAAIIRALDDVSHQRTLLQCPWMKADGKNADLQTRELHEARVNLSHSDNAAIIDGIVEEYDLPCEGMEFFTRPQLRSSLPEAPQQPLYTIFQLDRPRFGQAIALKP